MELLEIAKQTIEFAKEAGADEAEVVARAGTDLSVKVRHGAIEELKESRSYGLGLRVFSKKRASNTYTSDLSEEALRSFVKEAVSLATLVEPDEFFYLPDGPFADLSQVPDLDLYDANVPKVSAAQRLAWAQEAEEAAKQADPRITNSEGATCDSYEGYAAFANSAGFGGANRGTYQSISVSVIADDVGGKKRNASDYTAARHLSDLKTPKAIGQRAADRAVKKLGAQKASTCEAPVVFDPRMSRAILGTFSSLISGSAIYRKSSYLVGREGTSIASSLINITDDPFIIRGHGSRRYDGDGLAVQKNIVVEDGVLRTYLFDTYSARKLDRKSTGSASRGVGGSPGVSPSNFFMAPGDADPKDIIADVKQGLYLTDMMGFGFNPVTGDFSRGAAGFWIEDGKLTFPVSEITISANFNDLLQRIDAVGNELEWVSSVACPMIRVSKMTIAGK
jgi:PmbA protein